MIDKTYSVFVYILVATIADYLEDIAFIDLEASGLNAQSWPIEVGWCFLEGAPTAHLVKPDSDWSLDAWDEKAEALHGVSQSVLLKKGLEPEQICLALNEALKDKKVYSDAPDWDGFWLYRLFKATKIRQAFELSDFQEFFSDMEMDEIDALRNEASRLAPHNHRATDDVLHMRMLHRLCVECE